ncbi:MAG: type II secretion system protein [Patescibacteria group bacterium]
MNKGIALVEILVVIAIIGVATFSLYELVVLSRATVGRELRRTQALSLAQEGIEAVRSIRDQSWSGNIEPLSNGTNYYATLSGSSWALTTTNPGPIDALFNRTIVFASVNRDANSNISESGSVDENTRKVTSTVSWTDRGTSRSVALSAYITNFLGN